MAYNFLGVSVQDDTQVQPSLAEELVFGHVDVPELIWPFGDWFGPDRSALGTELGIRRHDQILFFQEPVNALLVDRYADGISDTTRFFYSPTRDGWSLRLLSELITACCVL